MAHQSPDPAAWATYVGSTEPTYSQCILRIETHTDDHARTDEQANDYEQKEKCFYNDLLLKEETHRIYPCYSCVHSVCFMLDVHDDFPL
jgi:hypothetical protein